MTLALPEAVPLGLGEGLALLVLTLVSGERVTVEATETVLAQLYQPVTARALPWLDCADGSRVRVSAVVRVAAYTPGDEQPR